VYRLHSGRIRQADSSGTTKSTTHEEQKAGLKERVKGALQGFMARNAPEPEPPPECRPIPAPLTRPKRRRTSHQTNKPRPYNDGRTTTDRDTSGR